MSIEQALAELTAAVKENTAAHAKLAEVAAAAASGKSATASNAAKEDAEDKEPPKETAAQKKKRLAAEKKAKEEAAAAEAPELVTEITAAKLKTQAAAYMKGDDEETRDANKKNVMAALKHLGASKLPDLDDDDRAKLASYITYWEAGHEVDFEEIDGKLSGDSEEGDDLLG